MGSIGFGLERLARPALAQPAVAAGIALLIVILAAGCATMMRFGDDGDALFRGGDPESARHEAFLNAFTDSADLSVVLLKGDFSREDHATALEAVAARLERDPAVASAASILSLRAIDAAAGPPGAGLFEDEPAAPSAGDRSLQTLAAHPLNRGRLLAEDLGAAAIYIAAAAAADAPEERRALEASARLAAAVAAVEPLLAPGVELTLTGVPELRREVVETLFTQQPILLAAGLIAAFALGVFLLGRFSDACVVAIAPVVSILLIYGAFGAGGVAMTPLLNNLPLLALALAFAASMHLVFAARRALLAGDYAFAALRRSIDAVGPAVALSMLTTAAAFLSLVAAGSDALRSFGLIGAATVFGVLVAALLLHPPVIWIALRLGWRPVPPRPDAGRVAHVFEGVGVTAARRLFALRRPIALCGALLLIAAAWAFLALEPRHSLTEDAPEEARAVQALRAAERSLALGASLHLPLPIALDVEEAQAVQTATRLRVAHEAAAGAFGDDAVFSTHSLLRWLSETNRAPTPALLDAIQAAAPAVLLGSAMSKDRGRAALTVTVPLGDDRAVAAAAARLEQVVGEALDTDMTGRAAGAAAFAARRSGALIERVGVSLALAAVGAALLAAVAFRAPWVFAATLVPNALPVLLVGATLFLLDQPLQLASALAMTIALGVAVDDTVHMIHAYARHRRATRPRAALARMMRELAPVLLTTTLVLSIGLAPAFFSWSPSVATFAMFAVATLSFALVADALTLPPLLALLDRGPGVASDHDPAT